MPHFKKLTAKHKEKIEKQVKSLLHACRDAMRNRYNGFADVLRHASSHPRDRFEQCIKSRQDLENTKHNRFKISDAYYGEAFGVFRTLEILGYGALNLTENTYHNLRWWLFTLEHEVLTEEGFFDNSHKCDFCVNAWGKDDAGRTRKDLINA